MLPELLGKWYTWKDTSIVTQVTQEQSIEEDSGIWCVCREVKGGSMIACDDKVHVEHNGSILNVSDLLRCLVASGYAQHARNDLCS